MRVGHGEKMSRKMGVFMQALLSSATIEDAAAIAGISPATAYRWHSRQEFQSEFKRLQGEVTGHALAQLKNSMGEALAVLRDVMGDAENPPSARVAAARTILDNAFKSIETADILERLEALEAASQAREAESK
jgi:hypothetical protein